MAKKWQRAKILSVLISRPLKDGKDSWLEHQPGLNWSMTIRRCPVKEGALLFATPFWSMVSREHGTRKLAGVSYLVHILAQAVNSRFRATREALLSKRLLNYMLRHGVTVEASDLWFSWSREKAPVECCVAGPWPWWWFRHFMAMRSIAWHVPRAYLDLIIGQMLPKVKEEKLWVLWYLLVANESRYLLSKAKSGLQLRIHADNRIHWWRGCGGGGASSAEHLMVITDGGIPSSCNPKVIEIFLPAQPWKIPLCTGS